MSESPPATKSVAQLFIGYIQDFGVLKETGREYWGIQIINFLDCTFYFAMLTIATLFLSHDLGMSDRAAGRTFTVFTVAVTILLTFSGMFCDWLGIRRSLRLSMWSMLLLRAITADNCPIRLAPINHNPPAAASSTANVESSGERATCPSSLACSNRLGDAGSVRSKSLSSAMPDSG